MIGPRASRGADRPPSAAPATGLRVGAYDRVASLLIALLVLLGTLVTDDPDRAHVAGFFLHLGFGQLFALGYAAVFALLGEATWWLGAGLGLLHGFVALTILVPLLPGVHPRMASDRAGPRTAAALEPPGLLALNYGVQTPAVTIAAHILFGAALGLLLTAS